MRGMRLILGLLLASAAVAQDASLEEAEKRARAKDYEGALAEYDKAIAEAPGDARGHVGRAWVLKQLGRPDQALVSITRAIQLVPEPDVVWFHLRGMIYMMLDEDAAAIEDFTKAIELDPAGARYYQGRAIVLWRQYDYAGALRDFSKQYELDPRDLLALQRCGQTKEWSGDFKGAAEDYTRLVDASPHPAGPLVFRGNAKAALGDLKGAISDYDAAIGAYEKYPWAYLQRARARLALGEKEAADADAAKAAEASTDAANLAYVGRYYYDTGRPKEAVADLTKAVQDPKQESARPYLFLARAKLGERAEAAADLKAWADGRRKKGDRFSRIAAFLTGALKEEEFLAAAKAENVHRAREQECEACWYAGAVRLLDGDAAGAKRLFERCIATDGRTFIEYQSAKMALAAMK